VLHDAFGVRQALMNEVHSYTGNQNLVDGLHDDPRRARAAALNIVPTSTAAPAAVEKLIPELAGRLAGQAVRVPTPDVALLDLVATLESTADAEAVRAAYQRAASGPLRGLLAVSDEPLVSSDYIGDRHSAVVDLPLIQILPSPTRGDGAPLVRVVAWYDNETGYSHRLAELIHLLADLQETP
jgi:glyceraldehyde 3-phosphate dehydrogenase